MNVASLERRSRLNAPTALKGAATMAVHARRLGLTALLLLTACVAEVDGAADSADQSVAAVRSAERGPRGGGKPPKGDQDAGTDAGTVDAGGDTTGDSFIRGPEPTVQSASKAGPYTVRSYTGGFRDGPEFADATIWYPSNAQAPFAISAVVPGWVSAQADIATWGPFLASHGIVTMTIGTNSPATDLPENRRDALLDALASLELENTRRDSPLYGKLELDRQAVLGWSMGGGGALLAANENPSLKAAISMCGWGTYDLSQHDVPSLMFAGTADVLAGGHSQPFYEGIPRQTPKLLYEVSFGDHWVANKPANENGQIGLYGLSWLKVYLEGDERYTQFLRRVPQNAADFRVNLP